ncbi:uncharacterized protein BJ212DRAFT_1305830 [Suillus subaureus]|uniref:Uncharacterized protein n=1 Tax=Suillus subaureus TaxID=48587 RepID=A0A9P7J090_9AGAM|nr:uncharacterized protein BJ212DRAFT_1305830 [Suillus subaureus]KAG1797995.1 hypothetical protein BJ212DRAFT_1305830 [Suillus subaureus]
MHSMLTCQNFVLFPFHGPTFAEAISGGVAGGPTVATGHMITMELLLDIEPRANVRRAVRVCRSASCESVCDVVVHVGKVFSHSIEHHNGQKIILFGDANGIDMPDEVVEQSAHGGESFRSEVFDGKCLLDEEDLSNWTNFLMMVKESTTKLWHKKEYQIRVYVWLSQLCLWLLYFTKASAFDPRGSECNTSTGRAKRGKVAHAEVKVHAENGRMREVWESHALIARSHDAELMTWWTMDGCSWMMRDEAWESAWDARGNVSLESSGSMGIQKRKSLQWDLRASQARVIAVMEALRGDMEAEDEMTDGRLREALLVPELLERVWTVVEGIRTRVGELKTSKVQVFILLHNCK